MYDIIIGRSEAEKEKYGTQGTIFLGKHYVTMGQTVSLSNKVFMDVAKSHVVFIVGKRGSGKCLSGDSLITLSDGSEIPIKEAHNNNKEVIALNNQLKIKSTKKTAFYTRKVNKLLHIKLRGGKEIKLTPEHPLLTIKGWVNSENLQIGSRIATPRNLNFFGNNIMPEHEIKILAYLIAEGHIKKCLFFTNYDTAIAEDLRNSLKSFDNGLELVPAPPRKGQYRIYSRNKRAVLGYNIKRDNFGRFSKGTAINNEKTKIREFLEYNKIYNLLSKEKFVPEKIFRSTKSNIALFLNRMFSCDGSIYKPQNNVTYWEISYSSSSEVLAKQIQSLLLRFGILSKLRTKNVRCNNNIFLSYELVLDGGNVIKFINEIGFFGEKEKRQVIALKEMSDLKRNANVDTIPKEIWDVYRPKSWVAAGRELGYKSPKSLRSSINYGPSRQKLLQIAVADSNERIKLIAESDIFWDEIVSMELLLGDFEVFDITVPELHNFVANNVIVHNSYTMGVIAEGIYDLPEEIKNNLSVVMLDTMGIYWTMKYPNSKEKELMESWELEAKGLNVQIFTPIGFYDEYKSKGIPTDFPFSIRTSEINAEEWCMIFNISITDTIGILIERIVNDLKEGGEQYDLKDIIKAVENDGRSDKSAKDAVQNRFMVAEKWGLFSKEGTMVEDLVLPGQISILDVSAYATTSGAENLRSLVIGLVAQKLFNQRMASRKKEEERAISQEIHFFAEDKEEKKEPIVWLVIDECLPYSSKILTEHGEKNIGEIFNDFFNGKKINVIGYDSITKQYSLYPVTKCYKRPRKLLMNLVAETGQSIICTPDHKIFSSKGFCEAQKSQDIALPLLKPYKQNKKLIEARLLGAIFGDGWLATNGKSVGFSGKGVNEDLEKIKLDLLNLGFKSSSIYSRKTESKIYSSGGRVVHVKGMSHSITSSTKAHKYFRKLGAPVGTKVLIHLQIPNWILKSSKGVKSEFLAGLMGADGYIIKRNVNVPSDFNPIRLSFNKIETLEKNALKFAKQLKRIFEDVGVKVSAIKKLSGNIRKDGHKTLKIQITLAKSIINTIKYFENIGYRYCENKEIEGEKWLAYLRYRESIRKERNKLRIAALKLHEEKGFGKIRIGRMLGVPDYIIREWIYYKRKAGVSKNFPSFREWTKKRVSGNNLFVKIIKKIKSKKAVVYDISVEKVHNFVADGFLVHNCHEFLPNKGKTPATLPLITVLREGRQPGISLVLASQQPGKIHTDVFTQADIVIAHRLTANIDVSALSNIMQSYMRQGLDKELNILPPEEGAAIVFDDANEKLYPIRVRPRYTWHGGSAPNALPKMKKVFEF